MEELIQSNISESIEVKKKIPVDKVAQAAKAIIKSYKKGGKVLICGNGGSAADAQHIAAELIGRFKKDRPPLAAIALTTDTSILTAIGNDYGFDKVFQRQVEGLTRPEDIVIGISTSGNSPNVLLAIESAKKIGAITVGLTGKDGGKLKDIVTICINCPSNNTPHIQEAHITIGHIICQLVEDAIFK